MTNFSLPLPASELPESIRRFGDPDAPGPARTMAAKGLVPVKGADLVTLLVQLAADSDSAIATAASGTLMGVPEGVLLTACSADLPPAILDQMATLFESRYEAMEALVSNHSTADSTIVRVARSCTELISEVIAVNQQRVLQQPKIIEALYKNRHTRMSTADRLVELAARNGVELTGIPAFKEHVAAIQGQLIPEPTDEALPSDAQFSAALEHDDEDAEAIERDRVDGSEQLKQKFAPLRNQIANMARSEKIRMVQIGSAAARAILVRDPDKNVASAAIAAATDAEAAQIAQSKNIGEDILRYIGCRKEWLRNYDIKKALLFNPKTPVGIALKFLGHMRESDLKSLSRSRNITGPIKAAATQRVQQKDKARKGGAK